MFDKSQTQDFEEYQSMFLNEYAYEGKDVSLFSEPKSNKGRLQPLFHWNYS